MIFLGVLIFSFVLGSIPTGLLVAKWLQGIDIREHGSGNVGATNVYRTGGKLPGIIVLVVDVLKGFVPVFWLAPFIFQLDGRPSLETIQIWYGVAAVMGHIFNPFLGFNGGKGVATAIGVIMGLSWQIGLVVFIIWFGSLKLFKYVSVSSMAGAFFAPFVMVLLGCPIQWVLGGVLIALAILFRHRPNILRLLHGEEPQVGRAQN